MVKMYFNKTIKYKGTYYPPYQLVNIDTSDVERVNKEGAWIVGNLPTQAPKISPREIDKLREKAEKLNIKYKQNWGIKKLKSEIAKIKGG